MKTETKKTVILLAFFIASLLQKAVGQGSAPNNATRNEIVELRAQIENAARDNDRNSLWHTAEKIDTLATKLKDRAMLDGDSREQGFQQLLQMLQVIDAAQAVDFDPNDWPAANIAPPVGKSGILYDSGIAPEAIKDPDDRKAYEIALAKNSMKAKRFSFQMELFKMKDSLMIHVDEFRKAYFGVSESDLAALRSALDKTITSAVLRSKLDQCWSLQEKP